MIRSFRGIKPKIAASAYVDLGAQVIGDVEIGERASFWPCVVLRGDIEPIRVGSGPNIPAGTGIPHRPGLPALPARPASWGRPAVSPAPGLEAQTTL